MTKQQECYQELSDQIHTLIEQERVKLDMLKDKKFSKYKIAKQDSYVKGIVDTWNFVKKKIEK